MMAQTTATVDRLFICYVPGLDRRRVNTTDTPHVASLIAAHGAATLEPLPTTELVPSLVTGTYPHEHLVWQVSLKPDITSTWWDRLLDRIPDPIMKTVQCAEHVFNKQRDLVALPRRRRRRFISYRFKYTRRVTENESSMTQFNGHPSFFQLLGDQTRYNFDKNFDRAEGRIDALVDPSVRLSFYELYAFDMFCHWQMDQPEAVTRQLQRTDRLIKRTHELCEQRGIRFMLLVDHGQEPIRGYVDVPAVIRATGVPQNEYDSYSEIGACRFWFHTDRARQEITAALRKLEHVQVRTWQEMHQYNVCFEDTRFGEIYAYAEHGYAFYPHDFCHPIGSFYQSFSCPEQRGRRFNGRHRGNHGHLPDHPAEKGYVVLADDAFTVGHAAADIIDFAPSVMALLGEAVPAGMRGRPIFEARHAAELATLRQAG